ncbi:hypothetical protein FRC11_008773, partial [Ceratobasidium sp. 423]
TIQQELNEVQKRQQQGPVQQTSRAPDNEQDIWRRYHRIGELFRRIQMEISMSERNIQDDHFRSLRIDKMGASKLANYNSMLATTTGRRTCTGGTRVDVLAGIDLWADNRAGAVIYWLNGMAGTGKTTIACTVAKTLDMRGQLAASFICTRTSAECSDAARIIPTIAYQLSRQSTPFLYELGQALQQDPDIGTRTITIQFERLLVEPLMKAKDRMARNLVVVIDALDECGDESTMGLVLDMLFQFANQLPLKFFVTSRPEPAIYNRMVAQSNDLRSILHLHEIEKLVVKSDIGVFLLKELKLLQPTSNQLQQLTEMAGNFFIFAATVVRYVQQGNNVVLSRKRLTAMLDITNQTSTGKKLSDIDTLYTAILTSALDDERLETEERADALRALWTIVSVQEPIPLKGLAAIVGLSHESEALAVLLPLQSVIHLKEADGIASTFHASFPDYLFDPERSKKFFCDRRMHNRFIAHRCFDIMKTQLRFNICKLESSLIPDAEVGDLQERITRYISPELSYTCRRWGYHLRMAPPSQTLSNDIGTFLSHQLLFWIEVLNLEQNLSAGNSEMYGAKLWLKDQRPPAPPDLYRLCCDAYDFVNSCQGWLISTPHLYISALPFCPKSSLVFKTYQKYTKGLMSLREGQRPGPGTSVARPLSVAFTPDGAHIICGFDDGVTSFIRAQGETNAYRPFKPHRGRNSSLVTSFASLPDGTRSGFGSVDGVLCLSNRVKTPPYVKVGNYSVEALTFSSDGNRVASAGGLNNDITVWNAEDGRHICGPMIDETLPPGIRLLALKFPRSARRIVAGYSDRTVRIWSADSGRLVKTLSRAHERHIVSCMALSYDATSLACGSFDGTVQVYMIEEHQMHRVVSIKIDGSYITIVEFSPDSKRIAACSYGGKVRVLDAHSDQLIAGPFKAADSVVRSIGISPDGTQVVCCDDTGDIQEWSIQAASNSERRKPSDQHSVNLAFPWKLRPDGWVTTRRSELLFWAPEGEYRTLQGLSPSRSLILGEHGTIHVDFSNIFLGKEWGKCFI